MTKKIELNVDDKLKKITDHFGIETELTKFTEEIGELLNECYKRYLVDPEAGCVEEECADVLVVLSQIMLYFNVDFDKVEEEINRKVDRTIERIDSGWYDKHR